MTSTRSILVLGAGELGLPVLQHLTNVSRSQPFKVSISVLVRQSTITNPSPSKQKEISLLKELGVNLVGGDLVESSVSDLVAIFRPFHTVVSCTGFVGGRDTQTKIAKAVLQADVPLYFPWQFGVDYDKIGRGSAQDLFDAQLDVRDLLRNQNSTKWVIIQTGMFTTFLFVPYFGVVEPGEANIVVRALGSWDNAVSVTVPEDIGRVTARTVFDDTIRNEIISCAGDTIEYRRLAQLVEKAVGKEIEKEIWTVDELKDQLAHDPENHILKYRVVFAEGRGVSWNMEETINHKWGLPMEDVKTWMAKNFKV